MLEFPSYKRVGFYLSSFIFLLIVTIYMFYSISENKPLWLKPSISPYDKFRNAAVVSENLLCSEIGRNIMFEGGNSIDAAVAIQICIGVTNFHSSGIGGGFFMVFYEQKTKKCITINAREAAPLQSSKTMYINETENSLIGWKSIGVPGEIHGLWTAYKKYGSKKVSWSKLLEPSINLAYNGFPISQSLETFIEIRSKQLENFPELKEYLTNPITKQYYKDGDIMKRPSLAKTLQELAYSNDPTYLFYKGKIGRIISRDITQNGGYITLQDLSEYFSIVDDDPILVDSLGNNLTMCGCKPPSGFIVTQSIISIINEKYKRKKKIDIDNPKLWHRIIETQKFAYAQRTKLGDMNFVETAEFIMNYMKSDKFIKKVLNDLPEKAQNLKYYTNDLYFDPLDNGTSHLSVIDNEGNAVSLTSTINREFGSLCLSKELGIVWNDQMDDFSSPNYSNSFGYPPSPSNFILPKKRPMSSMSPMIIYNNFTGKVRLVIGASGGSYIISSVAQTTIRNLIFNQTIKEAVDAPRFHNQFIPSKTKVEYGVPDSITTILQVKNHQTLMKIPKLKNHVAALEKTEDGFIYGATDPRLTIHNYPTGF
ncbi:Gamma-glutamyltranspeptidase family-containing protein [Strongyloides ratti]|uniref:Gamma-glutamyltranspeptidase family-containing protein n=1 Tax=Strongyloides ratti TaxID=34506 RepID=A0A090MYY0_STRRB|nr:Gamma-glutamyltranspeptidase family-containing protein [Strongyloides ratti]CEF67969.1 Gamma-glutamyltranspeptidase family-containing protein [Strongyloides ratti]